MVPVTKEELEKGVLHKRSFFKIQCKQADFSTIRLREARLPMPSFLQVRFDFGDLTGGYFPGAFFEQCLFKETKMSDLYLRGSRFHQCRFQNCTLNGANLCECHFMECEFIGCDFNLAEFSECRFEQTQMSRCNLFLADFTHVAPSSLSELKTELKGALLPQGFSDGKNG
ncbi:MAG: hypothetical protein A2293_15330 [Elusimicrobia bacterium RIFOXYB2_FULL_49_7]|nr:MAG: hypothetical protein A2293_15330 [Elusimicrobia bacterium RIFOXYB2_FULL_49_7]